jgi:hypothetical protein
VAPEESLRMNRFLLALGLCLAALGASPRPASANILRWIDELSGPGPFKGWVIEGRVVCWGAPPKPEPGAPKPTEAEEPVAGIGGKLPCLVRRIPENSRRRYSLNVEAGKLWAKDNHLEYNRELTEDERRVKLTPVQVTFYWQPLRGLELGHGAGVFFFYGNDGLFERFTRFVIEPLRVDLRPFDLAIRDPQSRDRLSSKLLRMITLRQSVVLLPKGFTAADFNATGSFRTEREVLPSYSLLFDIEPLFTKRK